MDVDALTREEAFGHIIPSNHGKMGDVTCNLCGAKRWKAESPGLCCRSGRVVLPPLQKPPDLIHKLLTGVHEKSKHFLDHVREYNSAHNLVSSSARAEKPFPDGLQAFRA